jgi:hypothetical protein
MHAFKKASLALAVTSILATNTAIVNEPRVIGVEFKASFY